MRLQDRSFPGPLRLTGLLTLVGLLLAAGTSVGQQRGATGRDVGPERYDRRLPGLVCAADRAQALQLGLATADPLGPGQPAFFDQVPRIAFPTYQGEIRFEDFVVVGDHETVQFRLWDPETDQGYRTETWQRTGTETLGGKTVSVFDPSWPNREFERVMALQRWGWDWPQLFWGWFVVPSQAAGVSARGEAVTRNVWLRIRSLNLPHSEVRTIAADVQYTSHVANLVMPSFGDNRLRRDTLDFDEPAVARKFFRTFADGYEGLAILPRESHLGDFGAFHFNTRNQVHGIGKTVFDNDGFFGSDGTLQGIEVYPNMRFAANDTSSHEIAHQWASNFDWSAIAGIERAGHQPEAHAPLWTGGETLVGAVLEGTVRAAHRPGLIGPVNPTGWTIEATPVPYRFHPLTLYSMGLLPPDRVPPFVIFASQDQFDPDTSSTPDPGTAVTGGLRNLTIDDVVSFHGPRLGPAPEAWHRATIVVSRDGPLSQAELNYYSFFAERMADPGRTGIVSWEGYPSFDASTHRRIDLQSRIVPRVEGFETLGQARAVGFPEFARRDTRVLDLDGPLSTRWTVGQGRILSGRVIANDRSDFDRLVIRFSRHGGATDDAVRFETSVAPDGRFSLPVEFQAGEADRYVLEVFLFWPGAGPQLPRARLSPVTVFPAPPGP